MLNTWESPRSPSLTSLVCQGVEVQHLGSRNRVPWIVDYATRGWPFETKNEGRRGVGSSPRSERGQIILGVCQLLSPLCTRICGVGIPTDLPYEKGHSIGMGTPSTTDIQEIIKSFI